MNAAEALAVLPSAALLLSEDTVLAANLDATSLLGRDPTGEPTEQALPGLMQTHGTTTDLVMDGRLIEVRQGPETSDGCIALLRDVTQDRRQAVVVDTIADSVLLLDRDGVLLWRSENSQLWTGVPHADIVGTRHLARLHPEDVPEALRQLDRLFANPGERVEMVARGQSVEVPGTWEQVTLRGVVVDQPAFQGVLVDVTVLDSGLRTDPLTRAAGASIAEMAPVGIVICTARGETVYGNRMAGDLLGPEFDPVLGSGWTDRFDDEDRTKARDAMQLALKGEEPDPFVVRHDLGGERRWLRVIVRAQAAGDQAPHSLMATLEDITDEVEARAQAHRLEVLLDNIDDYVASFDAEGVLLWANRAVRDLMATHQVDVPEMLGGAEDLVAEAQATLAEHGRWTGEVFIRAAPDGTSQVLSLTAVADEAPGIGLVSLVIARDISRLKQVEGELRELATHDPLTGLANRALFGAELERALTRRQGDGVGVLYADLDGFKPVNDEFGHASGDWLLELVADRLRESCRAEDLIARLGGDEFAVLVVDPGADDLSTLAERVHHNVTAPVDWLPNLRFGLSIGVAFAPADANIEMSKLLRTADDAMYAAKRSGGGVVIGT